MTVDPRRARAPRGPTRSVIAMAFSALSAASVGSSFAAPVAPPTRPPIDVAAPATVRTATFAVG